MNLPAASCGELNGRCPYFNTPAADRTSYERLAGHGLFSYAGKILPVPDVVERLLAALTAGTLSVEGLAKQSGIDLGAAVLAVSVLAKMGLLRLE